MSRKIRWAVLFVVLVNVFVSSAHALPVSGRETSIRTDNALAAAWEWLGARFVDFSGRARLERATGKAGSQMDPNGCPSSFLASVDCKAGSHMDPDGNH